MLSAWFAIWHWVLNVTGDVTPGTKWNLAWSGFLSAGVISTGIFTHTWHDWKTVNCNSKRCLRIGRHPYVDADGVQHHLCHQCHPVLKGQRRTRAEFHLHHATRHQVSRGA